MSSTEYRVVKAYHLVNDETGQANQFDAILIFQAMWRDLSPTQREALQALSTRSERKVRKGTLDRLVARQLVQDGALTPLGEAVLHYRPGADQ